MKTMLDFEIPDLARRVEALPEAAIHSLPFGAIRIDGEGKVAFYSEAERRLSGYRYEAIGYHFFGVIAPCMDTPAFRGRIERALAQGRLDLEFDHIGDFKDRDRELRVRVQSASGGGCWIFMRREDEEGDELGNDAGSVMPGRRMESEGDGLSGG